MISAHERQAICRAIATLVSEEIGKLRARITALETRLVELEKAGIKYHGVYQRAVEYKRGAMVTHDGSLFCAVADVAANQLPGASTNWQLAAKRGAEAESRRHLQPQR